MPAGTITSILLASAVTHSAPLMNAQAQQEFYNNLLPLCGKAFEGKVINPTAQDESFSSKRLVMHVRNCADGQIQIPFHVGDNASRTWILTWTGSGISLKHDHRLPSGEDDPVTMYGGHTQAAGFAHHQSFPVDPFSQELFIKSKIPASTGNTWHMSVYPDRFTYALTREGRNFEVQFDLTKPVELPVTPWGYKD
ncbi:hypothetical protein [Paraferrimonas sedimenticola]|uniref:Secreted protein n=1 Tax=Paraferrimonas sedimenticola TaxID=375674 RepID=A0AA37RZF3_9GAMM|nr:hypothetical protein [Paraferrimonas sedimenticola]GLP98135.1 hypothetical protein GCM10007895_34420 [Paraferrimonas sedimenticola]